MFQKATAIKNLVFGLETIDLTSRSPGPFTSIYRKMNNLEPKNHIDKTTG